MSGTAPKLQIHGSEATDEQTVNALSGDDRIDTMGLTPGSLRLIVDGGRGIDKLTGEAQDVRNIP